MSTRFHGVVSICAALLQLIPALFAGWMGDKELIERGGASRREYIRNTGTR
jgi:hypothetical protein